MKNLLSIAIAFSFLGIDCNQAYVTPPKPTPVVVDTDLCQTAEAHLKSLCDSNPTNNLYCCQVVTPTKKGKSYAEFCREKQEQGLFLNPKCVSEVISCDQVDVCTNSN